MKGIHKIHIRLQRKALMIASKQVQVYSREKKDRKERRRWLFANNRLCLLYAIEDMTVKREKKPINRTPLEYLLWKVSKMGSLKKQEGNLKF
jgi:hypothetical protein